MRRLPILATLALAPQLALAQQADTHAIVGARVVTVSGASYERASIVMRDGLITAVGPDLKLPSGARVIDGTGLVVTPGLIDALSSIGLPMPPARGPGAPAPAPGGAAASPTPSPLLPQALALDRVKASEVVKARASGITTALVIPREGVLPGQSAILNLAGERPEAMVLRQPAALHLHLTQATRQYPGSLMGTIAYTRQALYDARREREAWAAWEKSPRGQKRPRYDASLAPWQQVLARRLPLVVTCTLENDVRRALALADEFDFKLVLAGVPQAFRTVELLKARRVPLLVSVNFDPPRADGFFGFDEERERRRIRYAERNPAELAAAGVPFALASAWAPDFVAGIRTAIEKGLASEAALRGATLAAAEALGLAETTGSLEVGKLANVVAWSGEPFAKDTKARYVFVDGRLYEPDEDERKDASRRPEAAGAEAATPGSAAAPSDTQPKADKLEEKPLPPLPTAPPPFPAGKTIAITGGTVLTVGPQGEIANGKVLIRDGKILAVGPDLAVPPDAVVIDAKGRYLTPGIIDTHSHTAVDGNVNECTDVITAETRVRDVIDQRDVSIYRQLAGGVTAINVLHGSCNAIGGQNVVLKLRWGKGPDELVFKEAPRGIKFALGENVKRSNFRVPGEPRYPGTRMGVEVVLREGFLRARAYKREWAEYQAKLKELPAKAERPVAPRRDLRLETLADILDGKILVHSHAYRADEMLMLMSVADEFGFKVRTFQHALEAYKIASEIARHGAGVGTFIDWWAFKIEALGASPYNPALLASKGVRVSLNSDSDELARRLYWDAAKAVKYGGVSEAEALRMITWNAAWQLGVDAYVGSIEAGKQADLAIWSAHPLSPQARCETTLVDGQVYFDRALDLQARRATPEWAPLAAAGQPATGGSR